MMRRKGIAGLLCLFYALFVFPDSTLTGCGGGWFGSLCQYKCRCQNDNCDTNGLCTGSSRCLGGWFGLACQYADVGFYSGDFIEITDGNDNSCITATSERTVSVSLNGSFIFTWMRIVVSKPDFANKISVSFISFMNVTACDNRKSTVLDNKTTDIYCQVYEAVEEIILNGDGVRYLCSAYVSGGRNVALREKSDQSSTYSEQSAATFQLNISFVAGKAVDGVTSQDMYNGFSCSLTMASDVKMESWLVTFSRPRIVTRYVIYSRLDAADTRLCGYSLESYDTAGTTVYEYTNMPDEEFQDVYTLIHKPLTVSRVGIFANIYPRRLSLCEVEIFGDSVCEAGKFGLDCALACQCPDKSHCLVSTGGCSSYVDSESNNTDSPACPPGTYGPSCGSKCSQFCATVPSGVHICNGPIGACADGCVDGYKVPTCTDKCDKGLFGAGCKEHCSEKCQIPRDPDVSPCHHVSGVCVSGCLVGGKGPTCNPHTEASLATTSDDRGSYIVFIIGACLALLVLLLMFLLRKKTPNRQHIEERHPR